MRVITAACASAALMLGAQAAHAANLVNDFELNGSLTDSVGSATLTTGGTLGATGVTFGVNTGPVVTGAAVSDVYTIDVLFSLSDDGPSARYRKLIDYSNLASDAGVYTYYSSLDFYPVTSSGSNDFNDDTTARLTISRDSAGLLTGYVDGVLKITYDDSMSQYATVGSVLNFFNDDSATGGREASGGFVDYIRIYDTALTPGQEPTPPAPEPATWTLMIAGVAVAGGALRTRWRAVAAG